ncbi:MAG: DUF2110 family protein [Asgard group archaeon]|nr:DUF2110 family protein [Asgard group archaeon]
MAKLTLMTKIHTRKQSNFQVFKKEFNEALSDVDVTITSIVFDEYGLVTVELEGEDEIAATNYLTQLYGRSHDLAQLKAGDIARGYICSSGKVGFGLFVDIGIKEPYKVDALIPLYTLREQLTAGKKLPVRKIINLFSLVNNFPVEIVIEEVSIGLKKIEARFSEKQLELFNKWLDESLDRLIIIGALENEIESTLRRTKHDDDIIEIEKLGWMEYSLACKFNTSAKGLIPEIGRLLPKALFEIFSPGLIKKEMND